MQIKQNYELSDLIWQKMVIFRLREKTVWFWHTLLKNHVTMGIMCHNRSVKIVSLRECLLFHHIEETDRNELIELEIVSRIRFIQFSSLYITEYVIHYFIFSKCNVRIGKRNRKTKSRLPDLENQWNIGNLTFSI